MADLPTRLDLYAIGRDYIVQRATKIDPAMVDVEGSDSNLFVGATSMMGDHVVKHLGYRMNALTLDGAEGEDLDRWAFDRYRLVRKGASPAVGRATFTRATIAAGAGSIPIGTVVQTLGGAEYVTTTVANFGATDLTSSANIRARVAGKGSQVSAGQIRRFQRPDQLFDGTIQVTNANPTAHGEDVESDELFRIRIRAFWKSARRGVLGAIEQGALSVPGIVSAQAVEVLTTGAMPARVVVLYIADSTGIADSAKVLEVQTALLEYRAGGIAVIINTSIPSIVSITLKLTFRANVDTVSLTEQVRAAIVEFVNSLPVNSTLLVGDLYSVLRRFTADGVLATQGSIVAPAGDLVPTVGQTLRTTIGNVNVL